MKRVPTDYDPAEALTSDEAIEVFLADAFETRDANHIAGALRVVARAKPLSSAARDIGDPTLEATLALLKSIGFELTGRRRAA